MTKRDFAGCRQDERQIQTVFTASRPLECLKRGIFQLDCQFNCQLDWKPPASSDACRSMILEQYRFAMFKKTFLSRLGISGAAAALALTGAAALSLGAPVAAQPSPPPGCTGKTETGVWLNVVANNVRSSDGLLAITVYEDNRRKFLAKGGSLFVGRVPAQKGSTRGCVFLPKTGVYAIALYHDENANRQFDRSLLPEEGFGFSNNPSTLAGLPAWNSVRLAVPKTNLTTHIDMRYP